MDAVIGRFSAHVYAIFRIVVGLLFFLHGTQKLLGFPPMKMPGGGGGGLPPIAMVAGVIELVCGFLIIIGFFTSIAAFIASGEMAVAYFMAHAPHGLYPTTNQGEPAVLFCFAFLYMAAHGSGIWSVDAMRKRGAVTASTAAVRP